MNHELDILVTAIDKLLVSDRNAERARREEEYGSVKSSFYASELGDGDRKLVYKFFADVVGSKSPLTGQNVRVFDNGDYVHLRYLDYLKRLGALLSYEQPIKKNQAELEGWSELDIDQAKDDGSLEAIWKVSGRYDQIIDLNVIKAYLEGEDVWSDFLGKNYDPHIFKTATTDTVTGEVTEEKEEVRWFPKEGYEPDQVLLDIKSMNEWGYKAVFEKNNHEDIAGYYDQLTYYGTQLGIQKTALLIEDKAKNRLGVVPVEPTEDRLAKIKEKLSRIHEHVRNRTVPEERCEGAKRTKFPCMWSTGQCEFYSHCWNEQHNGAIIPEGTEEMELPSIEELVLYLTDKETYGVSAIRLHLEGFPGGQDMVVLQADMPIQMLEQMLEYYADYVKDLDYLDEDGNDMATEGEEEPTQETATDEVETGQAEAAATATTDLYNENGELNLNATLTAATERPHPEGKAIDCVKCGQELVYKRLVGGSKPCSFCGHVNPVKRG